MFEQEKATAIQSNHDGSDLQLVTFNIGEEEFAVDILNVREIIRMIEVTKVPSAPEFVEGIINLRGKVIPIIDLRKKFGIHLRITDKNTRIIVIELNQQVIGFIVDRVSEVLRINKAITEPPPNIVSNVNSDYITSVGKLDDRLLILLDLAKVISQTENLKLSILQ